MKRSLELTNSIHDLKQPMMTNQKPFVCEAIQCSLKMCKVVNRYRKMIWVPFVKPFYVVVEKKQKVTLLVFITFCFHLV
jgi:hypothetical protein